MTRTEDEMKVGLDRQFTFNRRDEVGGDVAGRVRRSNGFDSVPFLSGYPVADAAP